MVITVEKFSFVLGMLLFFQVLVLDMLGVLDKYATFVGLFQVFTVIFSIVYIIPMLPTEAVLTPTMAVAVNVREISIVQSYAQHVIPMHVFIASQPIVQAMMCTCLLDVYIKMITFDPYIDFIPSGVHPELQEFLPFMSQEMVDIPTPTLNAIASVVFEVGEQDIELLFQYFGGPSQLQYWFNSWIDKPLYIKEYMVEIELRNIVRSFEPVPAVQESVFVSFCLYVQNMMHEFMKKDLLNLLFNI